jgi:hypothetical protein
MFGFGFIGGYGGGINAPCGAGPVGNPCGDIGTAPFCNVMLGLLFTGGLGGGNCVCGPMGTIGDVGPTGGCGNTTGGCGAGNGENGDSFNLAPLLPKSFGPT